jgi:hypothetical protein
MVSGEAVLFDEELGGTAVGEFDIDSRGEA